MQTIGLANHARHTFTEIPALSGLESSHVCSRWSCLSEEVTCACEMISRSSDTVCYHIASASKRRFVKEEIFDALSTMGHKARLQMAASMQTTPLDASLQLFLMFKPFVPFATHHLRCFTTALVLNEASKKRREI